MSENTQAAPAAKAPAARFGGKGLNIGIVVAAVVTVAGLALWGMQLSGGLVQTGMRNFDSWGLYITMFMFLVGLSAGGLIISSVPRAFGMKGFGGISKIAVWTSICCTVLAVGFVAVSYTHLHRSHRESVWSVQQLLLAFAERQRVHERRRKRQRQRAPGQRRVPHRRRRLGSSSLAILSERRPPGYHPERAKRVEGSRAAIAVRLPADAARDPSTPHFRRCAQDDDGMLRLGVSKHAKPSPLCRPFCASGAIIPMNCCIATMGSCGRGRGAGRRVFNVLTTSYLFLGGTGAGALAVLCVLECARVLRWRALAMPEEFFARAWPCLLYTSFWHPLLVVSLHGVGYHA